jgi:hypothetical protein
MENPNAVHGTPLHPVKIEVWCAVSCHRIVGSIFFENTINLEHYIDIVHEFLGQVTEKEIAKAWFHQDSTTNYRV